MKIRILFICCFCSVGVWTQAQVLLSKEQAQEDLHWLQTSLEYVHPRLYKYSEKQTFDSLYQIAAEKIKVGISGLDFLSIVSQINAQVNCGHLYTIPQFELREEVLNKKVLPFYVRISNDQLYIINDCSRNQQLANGAKILSINGKTAKAIINTIKKGIATDGYIESRKNRLMERYFFYAFHGFDLYYHLHVDRSSDFLVEYEEINNNQIKKKTFPGLTIEERKTRLSDIYKLDEEAWFKNPSPQFELFEDQKYAVLTLQRSFQNDKIDPDFDALLNDAFAQLKEKGIKNLILDLRNNEGGSEHQQIELLSYLNDQPFKLYQNIYLSNLDFRSLKKVIIERDSVDLLFNNDDEYMRKFSNNLWVNNYEYSRSLRLQTPKKNVFKGNLFVLINGYTFSSAADLAAGIKKTTNAIFIGEESGGTFEGPTGGNSIVIQLPNSQIMVRISPNIQTGYRYKKHPIGRGVLPDHSIIYTIEDVLKKKDLEMEKVLEMILRN